MFIVEYVKYFRGSNAKAVPAALSIRTGKKKRYVKYLGSL